MRFEQGCQSRCSLWGKALLCVAAAILWPQTEVSIAQEDSGGSLGKPSVSTFQGNQLDANQAPPIVPYSKILKLGYQLESFPVDEALARLESSGYSPDEARQLLEARMPTGKDWVNDQQHTEIVPSAQLQGHQLYVLGSRDYINSVQQQLATIQEFGLAQLIYTVRIVEIPLESEDSLVADWPLAEPSSIARKNGPSSQPNSPVVPASFTSSLEAFATSPSYVLNNRQIEELIGVGRIIAAPRIVGHDGAQVNMEVGSETEFLTSYQPVKDENGNDTKVMRPIKVNLLDGFTLDVTGTLDAKRKDVRLTIRFKQSEIQGVDTFTFETEHGPLTVQQPRISAREIQTTRDAPLNQDIAIHCGTRARDVVVEQTVPLIGKVPYVGKLFKNRELTMEEISTVLLIRCEVANPADEHVKAEDTPN